MKILFGTAFLGYKTYHNCAKELLKIYPNCEFAIVANTAPRKDNQSLGRYREFLNYITRQKEINYSIFNESFLDNYDEKEEIDFDELTKFEKIYKFKTIWRIVATQRDIGEVYTHDTIKYGESSPISGRKEILKYCCLKSSKIC